MKPFALSNRQRKELANRKTLSIALPHPPGPEIADPLSWARRVLDCEPGRVVAAEIVMVAVNVDNRAAGLASLIGEIHCEQAGPEARAIHVECVVAECRTNRPRRSKYPIQWPGSWADSPTE